MTMTDLDSDIWDPRGNSVGYRVLAKSLRFELWGAHEDLLPTKTRPQPRRDSKLA